MKQLRLGKIKGQEIAEWMNISYNTYRNNPTKYIKRLEDYCKFEAVLLLKKYIYMNIIKILTLN